MSNLISVRPYIWVQYIGDMLFIWIVNFLIIIRNANNSQLFHLSFNLFCKFNVGKLITKLIEKISHIHETREFIRREVIKKKCID